VLGEGLAVEDAALRPRKVEVERRSLAELRAHLAAVHLHDLALRSEERHDEATRQVLVARLAKHAGLLEPLTKRDAALPVSRGEAVAQRAVGEPQLEAIDHLDVEKAAPLEVAHALVALFQRAVVEVDDAREQGLVARLGLELTGERAHRAPCRQRLFLAAAAPSLLGG
jgi:hypothetical protein